MVTESQAQLKVVSELKRASRVNLRDLTKDVRFDASAYGLKSVKAQNELRATGYPLRPVHGEDGLSRESHNAFQFARCYVGSDYGVPFMGSSDIIFLDFRPTKFLSRKNTKRLDQLMIRPWDVLLSCSGTVGNVALAPPSWSSIALSQHVLRIRFDDPVMAGFITAFIRSPWGRAQTVGSSYGSVISHIEPQHLERVLVPLLPPETVKTIGMAFCRAVEQRDEANRLLREAEGMFAVLQGLPPMPESVGQRSSTIQLSELDGRFDGSYHSRKPRTALAALKAHGVNLTTVKDFAGEGAVRAVTKFRERVYSRVGIPFNSSKELFQLDPIGMQCLAPNLHRGDMDEIGLKRGMVAVTCSGTLGRVLHVPGYMNGWAGSQDFLRIVVAEFRDSAFLAAWLGSAYGQAILWRYGYGSVIRHIDKWMLESMPVPILPTEDHEKISNLAAQATELRESAWQDEQQALMLLAQSINAWG